MYELRFLCYAKFFNMIFLSWLIFQISLCTHDHTANMLKMFTPLFGKWKIFFVVFISLGFFGE